LYGYTNQKNELFHLSRRSDRWLNLDLRTCDLRELSCTLVSRNPGIVLLRQFLLSALDGVGRLHQCGVAAGIGPALMGFGMGLMNIVCVVMIQGSVEWHKRGSATALLLFSRTLGNTVGVAMVGAILNAGVVLYANALGTSQAATTERVKALLTDIGNIAGGGADPAMANVLDRALHLGFWGMLVFAVLAGAISLLIPVRELETLTGGAAETRKA